METKHERSNRIALNMSYLYLRMLFTMGISLYVNRLVLNTLGVNDYGIYNVVGGLVALFTSLSSTLSISASRFMAYEIGLGSDLEHTKNVFSTVLNIHVLLAIGILIVAEIGGIWFVNFKMSIPVYSLYSANYVLQFSILTFMVNFISIPYSAVIIAHEKMNVFAFFAIIDVLLRLAVILVVPMFLSNGLIAYSFLLLIEAIIMRTLYGIYCSKRFSECVWKKTFVFSEAKKMFSYMSWTFYGATSYVLKEQGVNIIVNVFTTPLVNAARGVVTYVNGAISGFTSNIMAAINPQIIKSNAQHDYCYMQKLVLLGSRFSFFMFFVISFPIWLYADFILYFWLGQVPPYCVSFLKLILIYSWIETLFLSLHNGIMATGEIKYYQILYGSIQLLNLPVSYLLLRLGNPPEYTYILSIIISIILLFVNLYFAERLYNLSPVQYLKEVLVRVVFVVSACVLMALLIDKCLQDDLTVLKQVIGVLCNFISSLFFVLILGCSVGERAILFNKIRIIKDKVVNKCIGR